MSVKSRRAQSVMFIIVAILTAITVLCSVICFIADSFFYTLDQLPKGEKIATVINNNGSKAVTIYNIKNPLGNAVRAEIYDKKTDTVKNFFWETDATLQCAAWIDNRVININGHFVDVVSDTFDSRRPIIDTPYEEDEPKELYPNIDTEVF